jgi:hypothetical protein
MKLTGAAILISRGMTVLHAAPAAYPYRSAVEGAAMSAGHTFLGQFAGDILVRCPSCANCGHLLELPAPPGRIVGSRFVCPTCAATRDWLLARDRCIPGPGAGPELHGFGLSLWLQVACCGEVLWAYNLSHVAFLERYVGARVRSQLSVPHTFLGNGTLESRLPRWMLSAKNRDRVLRGLESLREQAAQTPNQIAAPDSAHG